MTPALSSYRVLDLADEKGMFCGRVLADLGADVVKVERPGGDPARRIGPFYHDVRGPEKSLFWLFHNANKRGVTLDLEAAQGRELFRQLVQKADFLVETFTPGYLDDRGLGYSQLEKLNPALIMVSITPFGQTGPYKGYQGDDLIAMAMGGYMYQIGDPDRAPLRIMVPQSYVHAGAHAADTALIALYWRHKSGRGQHVDVSLAEAVMRELFQEWPYWEFNHTLLGRLGPDIIRGNIRTKEAWPCKDGQVGYRIILGAFARSLREVAALIEEEGLPLGPFQNIEDWDDLDLSKIDAVTMEEWVKTVGSYFQRHTKQELLQKALERGFYLGASYNVRDIAEFEQLQARGFWSEVKHEELGDAIRYPSELVKSSEVSWQVRHRAPLVGEHNDKVYGELGLQAAEIGRLKEKGVI